MPDRTSTLYLFKVALVEDLADKPQTGMPPQFVTVGGNDSSGFLTSMLQCIEAQMRLGYRIFVAPNTEEPAIMSDRGIAHNLSSASPKAVRSKAKCTAIT